MKCGGDESVQFRLVDFFAKYREAAPKFVNHMQRRAAAADEQQ